MATEQLPPQKIGCVTEEQVVSLAKRKLGCGSGSRKMLNQVQRLKLFLNVVSVIVAVLSSSRCLLSVFYRSAIFRRSAVWN